MPSKNTIATALFVVFAIASSEVAISVASDRMEAQKKTKKQKDKRIEIQRLQKFQRFQTWENVS